MVDNKIAELKQELALYVAIQNDYITQGIPVDGIRADAVYKQFCDRHAEVVVSQQRFTRILCKELGMATKQGSLDGVRGYFYERA